MRPFLRALWLIVVLAVAQAAPAHALSHKQRALLFSASNCAQVQALVDFVNGAYCANGQPVSNFLSLPVASYTGSVSGTGATVRTAATSSGNLNTFANGVPRITDLGLLIEEARTNLVLQSQTLSSGSWGINAGVLSAYGGLAPDGSSTASTFTENTAASGHYISQASLAVTSGPTVTASVFIAAGSRRYVQLDISNGAATGFFWAVVDTQTWTITEQSSSGTGSVAGSTISSVGAFRRLTVTGAVTGASSYAVYAAGVPAASGSGALPSYTGTSATMNLFGFDVQLGAFAASYIPTAGSPVIRGADVASISGNLVGAANWTVLAKVNGLQIQTGGNPYLWSQNDHSFNNEVAIYFGNNTTTANGVETVAGVQKWNAAIGVTGVSAGASQVAVTLNGTAVRGAARGQTATALGTWTSFVPTLLNLGAGGAGSVQLNGFLSRLSIWQTGSTDAQLVVLSQ